jgi:hypothetical protein
MQVVSRRWSVVSPPRRTISRGGTRARGEREQPPDILARIRALHAPCGSRQKLSAESRTLAVWIGVPSTEHPSGSQMDSRECSTNPDHVRPIWARMFHAKIAKLAKTGRGALSRYPRRTRYFPAAAAGSVESSPLGGWRATQGKAKGKRSEVSGQWSAQRGQRTSNSRQEAGGGKDKRSEVSGQRRQRTTNRRREAEGLGSEGAEEHGGARIPGLLLGLHPEAPLQLREGNRRLSPAGANQLPDGRIRRQHCDTGSISGSSSPCVVLGRRESGVRCS